MKKPHRTAAGRRGVRRVFRGFSLVEMLGVIAIIAILGGIGVVAGRQIVRSTRQTALDRMAEQIYMAASQNVRTLEASGQQRKVLDLADRLIELRAAAFPGVEMPLPALSNVDFELQNEEIRAVWLELRDLILPRESVSLELWSGQWALEFEPGSDGRKKNAEGQWEADNYQPMRVNSVFYSRQEDVKYYTSLHMESERLHSSLWYLLEDEHDRENLMDRDFRMNSFDARVGFYDGTADNTAGSVSPAAAAVKQSVSLSVDNGEKLTVRAVYDADGTDGVPVFILKLSGADGSGYLRSDQCDADSMPKIETEDGKTVWVWEVTLDSLEKPETQFKNLEFLESPHDTADTASTRSLTPGENYSLSLTVEQTGTDGSILKTTEAAGHPVINSLFDARSEGTGGNPDTVFLSCGRHLQNLDPVLSGVRGTVTAVQTTNISFEDEKEGGWATVYGGASFLPISGDYVSPDDPDDTYHLAEFHALLETSITGVTISTPDSRTGAARDPDGTADGNSAFDSRTSAGLFGAFSGSAVSGVTLENASITGGPAGGYESAGTLIGDAQSAVTLKNITVTAPLSGARPLVSEDAGAKSAGGLIGTISSTGGGTGGTGGSSDGTGGSSGAVKLDNCGVYLTGGKSADKSRADKLDILYGSSAAGGLVGQSAGNLQITSSYAALVVSSAPQNGGGSGGASGGSGGSGDASGGTSGSGGTGGTSGGADGGSGTVGGLIGASHGNLSVSSSYADCYLSGGTIGGIAGSLGENTETTFERTYSAGFALYHGQDPDEATAAGGQFFGTKSDGASVTFAVPGGTGSTGGASGGEADSREKCYSLFNFTDVTAVTAEGEDAPKITNITDQTDGENITGGDNFLYKEEDLNAVRLDAVGYAGSEQPGTASPYHLSASDLGMGETYPYPSFSLPQHGDWKLDPDMDILLGSVEQSVYIPVRIAYLLFDKDGTALVTDSSAFDTDGTLDGQRFKGTARLDATPLEDDASDADRAAYGTVMLGVPEDITGCAFAGWYTGTVSDRTAVGDLTRLLSAAQVEAGELSWQFESGYVSDLASVAASDAATGAATGAAESGAAAVPTVYAVYTDARPHTVTIEFLYLEKAKAGSGASFQTLYRGGVKILQSVKYEIPFEADGYAPKTIQLPEMEGYKPLDSTTAELGGNYLGNCVRLTDAAVTDGELVKNRTIFPLSSYGGNGESGSGGHGASSGDSLDADGETLTILTDQSYTYVVLYEYASTAFEIQYVFHNSQTERSDGAGLVIDGDLTKEAVLEKLDGGPAYSADDSAFRVIKHDLIESADSYASLYEFEFEGFELYKTENQNLGGGHRNVFHYRRTTHALSYDLKGGYDTEGGSRTSYRAARSVAYGEPLEQYLPADTVKRNGYALEKWALGAPVSQDWDPVQADREEGTERISAPTMPAADVEAAAVWCAALDKVRVEIYYQSVTDPLNAGEDGQPAKTYKLYSVNDLDAPDLIRKSGVPAYYERITDTLGNVITEGHLTEDHQGNSLPDSERVSEAFSGLSDFLQSAAVVQEAEDAGYTDEELDALRTAEAKRVERYLLPTILDGRLDLDDYHLRSVTKELVAVKQGPLDNWVYYPYESSGDKSYKFTIQAGQFPSVYDYAVAQTHTYISGAASATGDNRISFYDAADGRHSILTREPGDTDYADTYTSVEAAEGAEFKVYRRFTYSGTYNNEPNRLETVFTNSKIVGTYRLFPVVVAEGNTKCYSEVLPFSPEMTGRHLPYVDNGGSLVIRLYYDRSTYRMMFHYGTYYQGHADMNGGSNGWNNFRNVDWFQNGLLYQTQYYDGQWNGGSLVKPYLSKYENLPPYMKDDSLTGPETALSNQFGNYWFRTWKEHTVRPYTHYSKANLRQDHMESTWQVIFEGLYGAQFDADLWNDTPARNYICWSQVNGGTYTAQIPLTVFNTSNPDGVNLVEFGYFAQGSSGELLVKVEKDDLRTAGDNTVLTKDSFTDYSPVLHHNMTMISYPSAIFSDDGTQEYCYADGYEYWGYQRGNDLSSPILGWKGDAGTDRYDQLYHDSLVIAGMLTKGYWLDTWRSGNTYSKARLFLMRKTYSIDYSNAIGVEEDQYLYREPVSRLPALTADHCPFGSNYAFKGWYTSSSFAEGTQVSDEQGNFVADFRSGSGLFSKDENGAYEDFFRMPSYNLVLVARWEKAANTVTFHPGFPGPDNVYSDDTVWTLSNRIESGGAPDGDFYLVTDEEGQSVGSHNALLDRLLRENAASAGENAYAYSGGVVRYVENYGGEADAWICAAGDMEWRFDGWYYYHGAADTGPNREALTQQYNLTAPVVSDDHLYARWTQTKGILNLTVLCRDRDTQELIRDSGGAVYSHTMQNLNINVESPETVTVYARTDIPGYFPALASKDVQVLVDTGTVYMDYVKGVSWTYTIHPRFIRAVLDDGTVLDSPLFADTSGVSDSWEAQIPAPQYAGYAIQANADFDSQGFFYHQEDLSEGEGSVWERMDGQVKELTACYLPDATAFTIPTEPVRLDGDDVGRGWLKDTPLLTGRFYREYRNASGTLLSDAAGMPWIGDAYRLRVTYWADRTDENGRAVLDENKAQIRDAVTVYYGGTEADLLDGSGNGLDRFGFLDDGEILAADREYEIHVDAAFVDGAGTVVLDLLRDGVPAPLADQAEERGLTPAPCVFTVQVGNPPED